MSLFFLTRLTRPAGRTVWASVSLLIAGFLPLPAGASVQGNQPDRHFARPPQVQGESRQQPAPIERRPPSTAPNAGARPNPQPGIGGQHLSQWMETHRALPLADQQKALTREPGFKQLQPQTQQRIQDRLTQLNRMSPDQRQRTIERTEQMGRLTVPQRQQVRGAMQQLGSLPEDRRRAVSRTYRSLRDLPEAQRQTYLASPQAHRDYSDEERSTLNNLLSVSPMLPQ